MKSRFSIPIVKKTKTDPSYTELQQFKCCECLLNVTKNCALTFIQALQTIQPCSYSSILFTGYGGVGDLGVGSEMHSFALHSGLSFICPWPF